MTTIEYICKNCKSDPFDKYSTDDEGYIYNFHIDAGHDVVEYNDNDYWNDVAKNTHEPKYYKGMFDGQDKIDNVAYSIQEVRKFRTIKQTDEILQYDGKIYNFSLAESTIKEETEKLIPNCTTSNRNEVINKIKAKTYTDNEKFDTDLNLITLPNGILDLDTLEIKNHTHEHLSRILFLKCLNLKYRLVM